jgi:transcriptional regulator with XRE-family HTH domain
MARGPSEKPKRLAEKLLTVRNLLGLSQTEMLKRLEADDRMDYYRISEFESGKGEPSLLILLAYARAANISTDVLIDDEIDLPARLPSPTKSEGIRRKSPARRKQR